jgi:ProP effector
MGHYGFKAKLALRVRADLVQRFPNAFFPKGAPKKPLKIGIFSDLRVACPDISWYALQLGLGDYCRGVTYQGALQEGAVRIDLAGHEAGIVTEEEARLAKACVHQCSELHSPQVGASSPA